MFTLLDVLYVLLTCNCILLNSVSRHVITSWRWRTWTEAPSPSATGGCLAPCSAHPSSTRHSLPSWACTASSTGLLPSGARLVFSWHDLLNPLFICFFRNSPFLTCRAFSEGTLQMQARPTHRSIGCVPGGDPSNDVRRPDLRPPPGRRERGCHLPT